MRTAFVLTTARRQLDARAVILTSGGMSYPGCGTTGDGYAWAAELGHQIVTPRPALTPVLTAAEWVKPLSGVTIPDVAVQVCESAPEADAPPTAGKRRKPSNSPAVLAAARGSFLFTHFGLSGPVVLDVSRAVSGSPQPQTLELRCDFWPARIGRRTRTLARRAVPRRGRQADRQLPGGTLAPPPGPDSGGPGRHLRCASGLPRHPNETASDGSKPSSARGCRCAA